MLGSISRAALAAGAGLFVSFAAAAQTPQSSQTVTPAGADPTQRELSEQADQIKTQAHRIDELERQLKEVTAILGARVDRVENATDSGKVVDTNPGARIEGPNQRNSMNFIGAVQVGVGAVKQSDVSPASPDVHSGSEIRRARIGVQGTAFDDFAYQVEIDLAPTGGVASAAKDIYVQYNGFKPFSITAGNIKPQTGLEATFSDRSNAQTFLESSQLTTMYASTGTRNVGLRVNTGGEHWSGAVGVYGDDLNNNGVATAGEESFGVHARATWAPIIEKTKLLHFGIDLVDRGVSTDNTATSQLRVRAQPDSTIDATRLIDTGNLAFADGVKTVGLESIGQYGPFGYQSEWGQMKVDRTTGRPDDTFSGGYFSLNWFLTGESRSYDGRTGLITRFSPKNNFDPKMHKWGAFEVAARFDELDLNSDKNDAAGATLLGVRGGEEKNFTAELNWYWNPWFRIMLDYVHADAKNRTNALPGPGALEGEKLDLIGLRVQQEW